jgi:peptidoglycan/xylan/chitin deacetylase (PgdA/CDA1 family)
LIRREILKEILNHQGVIFDVCDKDDLDEYSVILSTQKLQNYKDDRVILLDKKIIDDFSSVLSGDVKLNEDEMIKSSMTNHELFILGKIVKKYEDLRLPFVRKWYWPNFKKICIIVVHDIDLIDVFPGVKNKKELVKYILYRFILLNYGDNIEKIIALESEKNIKSTFFFLSNYRRKIQKYMELRKNHKKLIKKVLLSNREISLHGTGDAAINESVMMKEKSELEGITGQRIIGYRQHLLNYVFKLPDSLRYLINSGFSYDLSLSDNDHFGFMKGICYPYHPFLDGKKVNLIEIAVAYEDWISLSRDFKYEDQTDTIDILLETVNKYNGCLSFCIHNNYVNELRYNQLYNTFVYILNKVNEDCWATSAGECVDWWERRENSRIQLLLNEDKLIVNSDTELPMEIIIDGERTYRIIEKGGTFT